MFEKNERNGSIDEAAAQADEAQPISSDSDQQAAATDETTAEAAAAADAEAEAAADEGAASDASQPAADAEQQPKLSSKQRRKQQRRRSKKAAKAAVDDASRRRFNRVRIDEFPVASQLICELMAALRKELIAHPVLRDKVFQVWQLISFVSFFGHQLCSAFPLRSQPLPALVTFSRSCHPVNAA
jgi:hypothetical protein